MQLFLALHSDCCVECDSCQDTKVEEEGVLNDVQIPHLIDIANKCQQQQHCYNDCQQIDVSTSKSVHGEYEEEYNAN